MGMKRLLSLCFLLPLLAACGDDEQVQVPASFDSFEVRGINYFFEGGDGVQTYEIVADSFEYYNDSDVEKQVGWTPKQSDYDEYTFLITTPEDFDWPQQDDTLWVYDISMYDGYPSATPVPVPYQPGATMLWPDGTYESIRITVPPYVKVAVFYRETFMEVTSSYLLELENTTTGEPLLLKGKLKKKSVVLSAIDAENAEANALRVETVGWTAGNAPRRRF